MCLASNYTYVRHPHGAIHILSVRSAQYIPTPTDADLLRVTCKGAACKHEDIEGCTLQEGSAIDQSVSVSESPEDKMLQRK